MRVVITSPSHAAHGKQPRKSMNLLPSYPGDLAPFLARYRGTDCATGYTVHRQGTNLRTIGIIDPFDPDEIGRTRRVTYDSGSLAERVRASRSKILSFLAVFKLNKFKFL